MNIYFMFFPLKCYTQMSLLKGSEKDLIRSFLIWVYSDTWPHCQHIGVAIINTTDDSWNNVDVCDKFSDMSDWFEEGTKVSCRTLISI